MQSAHTHTHTHLIARWMHACCVHLKAKEKLYFEKLISKGDKKEWGIMCSLFMRCHGFIIIFRISNCAISERWIKLTNDTYETPKCCTIKLNSRIKLNGIVFGLKWEKELVLLSAFMLSNCNDLIPFAHQWRDCRSKQIIVFTPVENASS